MELLSLLTVEEVAPGSHVSWVVDDESVFARAGGDFLDAAAAADEKAIYFGPKDIRSYAELRARAAVAADPLVDFLAGGPLEGEAMFRMFREQLAAARAEGFRNLRLLADMDWLLPLAPTAEDIIDFELLLDRETRALGGTIVCAYRARSFDVARLVGAACVHPVNVGASDQPEFQLVADGAGWQLSGEVDVVSAGRFHAAITAALREGDAVVDASRLQFMDVAGMRSFADAAASARHVRVVGARTVVRRCWSAASFDRVAARVEFVS